MSSSDEDPTSASADEIEASDSESEEALPPIQLPDRTTRGKRVAQVSILCRKCGKASGSHHYQPGGETARARRSLQIFLAAASAPCVPV